MNRCTPGFTYNMEAQRSLFKNDSYYGRFSSTSCFSENSFQTLRDWFVDYGIITAGSASQAFEGRHYCRSMRLHKERFHALVQRRVGDITNKFELMHLDLLSNLSELRERPSSKALECVTNMKEYKVLVTAVLSTTGTRSQMVVNYLKMCQLCWLSYLQFKLRTSLNIFKLKEKC